MSFFVLSPAHILNKASEKIPIFYAANISVILGATEINFSLCEGEEKAFYHEAHEDHEDKKTKALKLRVA